MSASHLSLPVLFLTDMCGYPPLLFVHTLSRRSLLPAPEPPRNLLQFLQHRNHHLENPAEGKALHYKFQAVVRPMFRQYQYIDISLKFSRIQSSYNLFFFLFQVFTPVKSAIISHVIFPFSQLFTIITCTYHRIFFIDNMHQTLFLQY